MEKLDQKYQIEIDTLRGVIQASDLLAAHLEAEEESTYQALREMFEPEIEALYEKVAEQHPLQLTTLEDSLLHPEFEGLYLIRILGFSVLRGEIDEEYRFKRPQDHFKRVLLALAESSNFDFLKGKVGQTVQIGFALSSEIWVSNLINAVTNRTVKHFLESMMLDKYKSAAARKQAFESYQRQFAAHNYHCAEFPRTVGELKSLFSALEKFIQYRIRSGHNNSSLLPSLREFFANEAFQQEEEYLRLLILFSRYFPHADHLDWLKPLFNEARTRVPEFSNAYFHYLLELEAKGLALDRDSDMNVHQLLDPGIQDDLLRYSNLILVIHQKGYIHEEAIEATRTFHDGHDGLSDINECLRHTIYQHFDRLIRHLPEEDYKTFTGSDQRKSEDEAWHDDSIARYMRLYMDIFANQEFTIRLRDLSMAFVHRCLSRFTDKRGAPYQDIKHFVLEKFTAWGFLREKEAADMFKTARKRKAA